MRTTEGSPLHDVGANALNQEFLPTRRVGTQVTLYPDELIYSACARFSDRVRYLRYGQVVAELFGDSQVVVHIDFPTNLEAFSKRLSTATPSSADPLIDHHTLFPFYAPFLPPSKVEGLRTMMRTDYDAATYQYVAALSRRVCPPLFLRLCPMCLEQDRCQYGEAYWHRSHQLPSSELCPEHECRLLSTSVPYRTDTIRRVLIPAEHAIRLMPCTSASFPHHLRPFLLDMAKEAAWLLRQPVTSSDQMALWHRYIALLADRNLATYNGRVRERAFINAFAQRVHPELLSLLKCPGTKPQASSPLLRLIRPPKRPEHPLHHFLLRHFLDVPIHIFFGMPPNAMPFGSGPWPCLNASAPHYYQKVVRHCQTHIDKRDGRPIGTFFCRCGYVYERQGPDWGPLAQFTMTRRMTPGEVESSALATGTVAREYPPGIDRLALRKRRQAWLIILQQCRNHNRQAATASAGKLYRWLYEHDREWLLRHRPSYRPRSTRKGPIRWEEKDASAVDAIEAATRRLKDAPGIPIRLYRTTIIQEARLQEKISTKFDRLPQASKLLNAMIETPEDFIRRKLTWAVDLLRRQGYPPTRRQLILRSGLGFGLWHHPAVGIALSK